jgi:outer membrane protein OmpA-like peptidoglycan-associated protein
MMLNALRRWGSRWAAIAFFLAAHHSTCASMSTYADTTLELDFERNAVALDAKSRSRLAAAVDLARSWCGFEFAFVTGHADPSEGDSSRARLELSEARAAYVRQLLRRLGVPESRAVGEAKGATQPYFPWSGRVDVYLKAEGPARKDRHRDGKDQCRDGWSGT